MSPVNLDKNINIEYDVIQDANMLDIVISNESISTEELLKQLLYLQMKNKSTDTIQNRSEIFFSHVGQSIHNQDSKVKSFCMDHIIEDFNSLIIKRISSYTNEERENINVLLHTIDQDKYLDIYYNFLQTSIISDFYIIISFVDNIYDPVQKSILRKQLENIYNISYEKLKNRACFTPIEHLVYLYEKITNNYLIVGKGSVNVVIACLGDNNEIAIYRFPLLPNINDKLSNENLIKWSGLNDQECRVNEIGFYPDDSLLMALKLPYFPKVASILDTLNAMIILHNKGGIMLDAYRGDNFRYYKDKVIPVDVDEILTSEECRNFHKKNILIENVVLFLTELVHSNCQATYLILQVTIISLVAHKFSKKFPISELSLSELSLEDSISEDINRYFYLALLHIDSIFIKNNYYVNNKNAQDMINTLLKKDIISEDEKFYLSKNNLFSKLPCLDKDISNNSIFNIKIWFKVSVAVLFVLITMLLVTNVLPFFNYTLLLF